MADGDYIDDPEFGRIEVREWVRPSPFIVRQDCRYREVFMHLIERGELIPMRLADGRVRLVDREDPRRVFATLTGDGAYIEPAGSRGATWAG